LGRRRHSHRQCAVGRDGMRPVADSVSAFPGHGVTIGSGHLYNLDPGGMTPTGTAPIEHRRPLMITLTETAASKVKELIEAEGEPGLALRVAVRPGGCSGYSYEMFFDSDISDDDRATDYGGVKVVSDAMSAQLLDGATLDFKDGLMGAGFAIENPNAQSSCGCGKSFS